MNYLFCAVSPRSYPHSDALRARTQAVTPAGAQTSSRAPGRLGPLGAFPLYADRGEGPWLWCVDGYRYADWFNANGAVTLGHAAPAITAAIAAQLSRGTMLSLPCRLEAEVAERLTAVIPCAEQVRFIKTGSEATEAAIRVARMATGRPVILTAQPGYHSWHSWHLASYAVSPGVPRFYQQGTRTFRYNDLASLSSALADDVALVMIEPVHAAAPVPGFLDGVIQLAHEAGALVCFDETICGNRWHAGGAQAYFGVTPDLATFGKASANGVPLAFLCGPASLMHHAWAVSSTFGGDLIGLAACLATIDAYEDEAVLSRLWEAGRRLLDTFTRTIAQLGLPATVSGYPCHPVLTWHVDEPARSMVVALFQQELAARGVLAAPAGWYPSAAHDTEALEHTLTACAGAFAAVADALATPDGLTRSLRGPVLTPAVRVQAP